MKKLIAVFALAVVFTGVGCSALAPYVQPVAQPSAVPSVTLPAAPILTMICSSPAAKADAQIGAYCAIYNALGGK